MSTPTAAEAGEITGETETCIVCRTDFPAAQADAALWASAWSATLVGWSCSPACSQEWQGLPRPGDPE